MIRPTRAHKFRMVAGIVGMVVLCGLVASTLESNVFNGLAAGSQHGGEIGIFHAVFWTGFAYALLPILGVVGIGCMLVYDRIEMQRKTGYSLSIFDRVFEHTRNGLAVLDAQGRVENINPAYARMTGYTEAELQGRKLRELNSGRQSLQFYEDIWNAVKEQGHWEGEIWNRKKDGSLYLESIALKGLDQRESGGYEHFMVVITEVWAAHRLVRPFFGTGVLGGYTTFSTYAVEIRRLTDAHEAMTAFGYAAGTLAAALAAVWSAAWATRRALAWRAR